MPTFYFQTRAAHRRPFPESLFWEHLCSVQEGYALVFRWMTKPPASTQRAFRSSQNCLPTALGNPAHRMPPQLRRGWHLTQELCALPSCLVTVDSRTSSCVDVRRSQPYFTDERQANPPAGGCSSPTTSYYDKGCCASPHGSEHPLQWSASLRTLLKDRIIQ